MIIAACFGLSACHERSIDLPNAYKLVPLHGVVAFLENNTNQIIIKDPVNQFCVQGDYVYGWIEKKPLAFFFVNTISHEIQIFKEWKDLDIFLTSKGLPVLTMNGSFTYWDITTGNKRKTW